MSTFLLAATDEASIADVLQLLASQHLDRLPIVTTRGRLRGVVTAMDIVRWFAKAAAPQQHLEGHVVEAPAKVGFQ